MHGRQGEWHAPSSYHFSLPVPPDAGRDGRYGEHAVGVDAAEGEGASRKARGEEGVSRT